MNFAGGWIRVIRVELFVGDTFNNQKWLKFFSEHARQLLKQKEMFVMCHNAELVRLDL